MNGLMMAVHLRIDLADLLLSGLVLLRCAVLEAGEWRAYQLVPQVGRPGDLCQHPFCHLGAIA